MLLDYMSIDVVHCRYYGLQIALCIILFQDFRKHYASLYCLINIK